jgi:hypothetical protein
MGLERPRRPASLSLFRSAASGSESWAWIGLGWAIGLGGWPDCVALAQWELGWARRDEARRPWQWAAGSGQRRAWRKRKKLGAYWYCSPSPTCCCHCHCQTILPDSSPPLLLHLFYSATLCLLVLPVLHPGRSGRNGASRLCWLPKGQNPSSSGLRLTCDLSHYPLLRYHLGHHHPIQLCIPSIVAHSR